MHWSGEWFHHTGQLHVLLPSGPPSGKSAFDVPHIVITQSEVKFKHV